MADVYRLAREFRSRILAREKAAAREVIRAYGEAWRVVQAEADRYIQRLKDEAARLGVDLSEVARLNPSWPFRAGNLDAFAERIATELRAVAAGAGGAVRSGQLDAVGMALDHAERLAVAAIPPVREAADALRAAWTRPNLAAFNNLIGWLADGTPLRAVLERYGEGAGLAAREELLRGFILGEGPRAVGARLRRVTGGTLASALRVSRTEIIRAYRAAHAQSYQDNGRIVEGWVWHAALDGRSCIGCISRHGTRHPVEEVLQDHPNGRCAMVPATRPWRDLAVDLGVPDLARLPEPVPQIAPGAEWLAAQGEDVQRAVLGPRLALHRAGVPLEDMVAVRRHPVWGQAIGPRPVRELVS